jgi:hypothetical protein
MNWIRRWFLYVHSFTNPRSVDRLEPTRRRKYSVTLQLNACESRDQPGSVLVALNGASFGGILPDTFQSTSSIIGNTSSTSGYATTEASAQASTSHTGKGMDSLSIDLQYTNASPKTAGSSSSGISGSTSSATTLSPGAAASLDDPLLISVTSNGTNKAAASSSPNALSAFWSRFKPQDGGGGGSGGIESGTAQQTLNTTSSPTTNSSATANSGAINPVQFTKGHSVEKPLLANPTSGGGGTGGTGGVGSGSLGGTGGLGSGGGGGTSGGGIITSSGGAPQISVVYANNLIPVDGSNYNGSPLEVKAGVTQTGIPTLRDFNVAPLPVADPNLIPMIITLTNVDKAGTVSVWQLPTISLGQVSFWTTQQKTAAAPSANVPAPGANTWSETIYVEGTHESATLNDVTVVVNFQSNDGTESATSYSSLSVTPVLMGAVIAPGSVIFKDQNPVDGIGGLDTLIPPALGGPKPGFLLTSNVTAGNLSMGYVQDVMNIQNGFNGTGAGATFINNLPLMNLLPVPGSKLTFPAVDTLGAGPTYLGVQVTAAADNTENVAMADSPATAAPGGNRNLGAQANTVDILFSFQDYLVVIFPNNIIYPIANIGWQVNFYATVNVPGAGVSQLSPLSTVSVTSQWTASNDNPPQTGGTAAPDNVSWQ